MAIDIRAVTDCIEEAARTLVLPRFTRLAAGEIEAKRTPGDCDDVVTIVDHEVEACLSKALTAIDPAARVIGEEAVHRRPELLRLLASDHPLWIIDPIDGTKNFAAGDTAFGIMVAYVVAGCSRAAWVVLPARGQTFVAEAGAGTFINGVRVRIPPQPREDGLRGAALVRFMPDELRRNVIARLHPSVRHKQPTGCAAVEYTDILGGSGDFVVYYRLLPWDHAAPALVLTEAGGHVTHIDGRAYSPRSESQLTIVARDASTADRLRAWLPRE